MDREKIGDLHPTPAAGFTPAGEIFQQVLFRPSLETYEALLHKRHSSMRRTLASIFIVVGTGYLLAIAFLSGIEEIDLIEELTFEPVFTVPLLICGPLAAGLLAVLTTGLIAAVSHGIAWLLGGRGAYRSLFYLAAGIWTPLLALALVAGVVPWLVYFLPFLFLYGANLMTFAIRAVHGPGRVRTALAAGWLILSSAAALIFAFVLMTGRS